MRKLIGTATMIAGLAVAPAAVTAQHAGMTGYPKHEFGADITGFYQHMSALGAGASSNQVLIATPVDLRVGFIAGDKLVVEPRLGFSYHSKGGFDPSTGNSIAAYVFIPDVNVLWAFQDNKKGPYATVGAAVDLEKFTPTSTSQFSVNGGIGTRVPYESGAIRLEAFGRYAFKNTSKSLPNTLDVGARIGLSLWH